ncbi:MAG: MBL fold metallo-hydrolase [Chloroflexota bacterium]
MLEVGDIRIHLINDAYTYVDAGGPFGLVPRALYHRYFQPDDDNLIPMTLHCLLVQAGGKNIIVDTGMGTKLDERRRQIWHLERRHGGLVDGLSRLDLRPEDIHLVIDTHLHTDHCGGNTHFAEDGTTVLPTFPEAEYVVQRREYEDAIRPNERTAATYFSINWDCLIENGQMRLLDGEVELAPGVTGVPAPGHTPGHMAVRFESKGMHAVFVCDMASYAVHFERLGWMTAYDVEPLITLETKRYWQQWTWQNEAVVIFPHDPTRPAGRLRQDEKGRFTLEPVAMAYV